MKPPTSTLSRHRARELNRFLGKSTSTIVQLRIDEPAKGAWAKELFDMIREPCEPENNALRFAQQAGQIFVDIAPDDETLKYAVPMADMETAEAWGFAALLRNNMVRRINKLDEMLIQLGEYMGELDQENLDIHLASPDAPQETPNG